MYGKEYAMKKPGKARIQRLVDQVSFATEWSEIDEEIVKNTYLYKLLVRLKEAESAFESALEDEMETHEVEFS
jgi:hypothetical protein